MTRIGLIRNALTSAILIGLVTTASVAVAADPEQPVEQGTAELLNALQQAVTSDPIVQLVQAVEDDEGDENANPGAKDDVCSKDTPASDNSAICDETISPE